MPNIMKHRGFAVIVFVMCFAGAFAVSPKSPSYHYSGDLALDPMTGHIEAGGNNDEPASCPSVTTRTKNTPRYNAMVKVQSGTFVMGSNAGYPEERPAKEIRVKGFWIDEHEVTNAEFAAFVAATGYVTSAERIPNVDPVGDVPDAFRQPGAAVFEAPSSPGDEWWHYRVGANWQHPDGPNSSIDGKDNYPVVQVSYDDALAYAQWVGKDLPTEIQWEYAARSGRVPTNGTVWSQPEEANTWQGQFPAVNTAEDGFTGRAPVGCFEKDQIGLYDMIGNVWEWTSGIYNATAPDTQTVQHTIKGGSYLCAPNFCQRYRPEARQGQDSDFSTNHIGFRLVINEE